MISPAVENPRNEFLQIFPIKFDLETWTSSEARGSLNWNLLACERWLSDQGEVEAVLRKSRGDVRAHSAIPQGLQRPALEKSIQ
jgi:hypothetical protein